MANNLDIKDAANATKTVKTTDDAGVHTPHHNVDAIAAGDNNIGNVDLASAIPAGNNNIGDVDVASIAAGDNNIGNVDIVTMPNVTLAAGTNTNEVVGDVAQDAPVSGNPLLMGARASAAAPTDMSADGDAVDLWATLKGALNVADGGGSLTTDIGTALPAGNNNIGDVDVASIAAGDNNIGNVDLASAIPAGNNNIGDVDVASIAAGDNNIGNVDIVTVPADPFGATADAAVTAGATGSISAKLRSISRDLVANIVLAAGSNAIGKLAANSGVDIGDVDVLSSALPTGAATSAKQDTEIASLSVMDDWDNAASDGASVSGDTAHDDADAGEPVKIGARAIAHGTNPTAVAAADRTNLYANRAGVLFTIGGHPNIVTIEAAYTAAQTDTAIVTVAGGLKIVVTQIQAIVDAATTVNVNFRVGFAAATTPTTTGVVLTHPGILALSGSGISRGDGSSIVGVGADGEDLRITSSVPTTGSLRILVSYYTIES